MGYLKYHIGCYSGFDTDISKIYLNVNVLSLNCWSELLSVKQA